MAPRLDKKKIILEYAEAIVTALILALILKAYVVQAFKIPTGSMIPTLLIGDHLLVNKFIYGTELPFTDIRVLKLRDPKQGDIIVFKYPENPKRDFIKRVVGTGGDVIESRDKQIYVNGEPADSSFARYADMSIHPPAMDPRDNFGPIKVPEGKLFVMGDNRDESYDSRFWGYVDLSAVRGKAFVIYWSWDSDERSPRPGRIGTLIK